jgi:hypothetical protein
VGIGNPEQFPAAVQRALPAIDANGDGRLCVWTTTNYGDPNDRVVIVVDNPNNLNVIGNPNL